MAAPDDARVQALEVQNEDVLEEPRRRGEDVSAGACGRGGDWVASFGGSLRLTGGVRLPVVTGEESELAYYGPVGLPIGLSVQRLNRPERPGIPGFHLDLSPLTAESTSRPTMAEEWTSSTSRMFSARPRRSG